MDENKKFIVAANHVLIKDLKIINVYELNYI